MKSNLFMDDNLCHQCGKKVQDAFPYAEYESYEYVMCVCTNINCPNYGLIKLSDDHMVLLPNENKKHD